MSTDRIRDLLDDASDDAGRPPLPTPAALAGRGRARRRRRRALTASAAAAAAVVVALVLVSSGGEGRAVDPAPLAPPATSTPATSTPSPAHLTSAEQEVVRRCAAAGRGDDPLAGLHLDAEVSDSAGTTATFVDDAATRARVCTLGDPSLRGAQDALETVYPLRHEADPAVWSTQDVGLDFSLMCSATDKEVCTDRSYTAVYPRPENLATLDVTTPQGRHVRAVVGVGTVVLRFVEAPPADGSSTPPVVATWRAADGSTLVSYDLNEAMR